MLSKYHAERAVMPDGSVSWVVVDADYRLHVEGCAFLAGLRAADRSVNTERVYAGRVALFLGWCAASGLDWTRVSLGQMVGFKRWLVEAPLPSRRRDGTGPARFRSPGSADAVLGTVCEFLRFCANQGLGVPVEVARRFYEPRYLRHPPAGFETGEDGQFRTVRSRLLAFTVAEQPYEFVDPARVPLLVNAAGNPRDRFLVVLLAVTGLRIGEALGLHRCDMHLLSDSRLLGCPIPGPHVHVLRRRDNTNGALVKTRKPRTVPVTPDVVDHYADYTYERARLLPDDGSDLVFVNLYRPPLGEGMTYPNAKEMFDRLTTATGTTARPHLLRHTAATTMRKAGVARDAIQAVLGHVSPASMQPYLHTDEAEKRAAVAQAAAWAAAQR